MEEINYERDLEIDPEALDVEWLRQSQMFMKYSKLCAQSRLELDRAKEKLDVVRAVIDNEIRSSAEKKPTESQIGNLIIMDIRYKEANDEFLKIKYDCEILSAAVRAFDQRKSALENLVRLQAQNYFSAPSAPRDLKQEYSKTKLQEKSAIEGIKKRRRKEKDV